MKLTGVAYMKTENGVKVVVSETSDIASVYTAIRLIGALMGREEALRVYRIAVEERYRFFSFGDAMMID